MGSLAALRSPPAGAPPQDPWFTKQDGQQFLRDLVTFCRKGEFRIL